MAVYLDVAGIAIWWYLILCCPFSHEMSWVRSGTEMSQLLRIFLPTLARVSIQSSFEICQISQFPKSLSLKWMRKIWVSAGFKSVIVLISVYLDGHVLFLQF